MWVLQADADDAPTAIARLERILDVIGKMRPGKITQAEVDDAGGKPLAVIGGKPHAAFGLAKHAIAEAGWRRGHLQAVSIIMTCSGFRLSRDPFGIAKP
jgi:hypothetical protein